MRTVSVRLVDLQNVRINLGFVGENEHTLVRFDCKKVFKDYPDAIPSLAVLPPKGDDYPVVVTRDGDFVEWTVTDSDLIYDGNGEIQLTFTDGTEIQKTYKCKTVIQPSIGGNGTIPTPIENWVEQANEKLAAVEAATEAAESAAEHMPYIGEDGYWYEWNGTVYVKSFKAQGEDGAPGQKGDKGDPGIPGDPTQLLDDVTPSSSKAYSSAKVEEELTDVLTAIHGIDGDVESHTKFIDDSFTFEKIAVTMTTATSGAVLNDGVVHTEGSYSTNFVYSSYVVTSDNVNKPFFIDGVLCYAINPFVFVGTSGKIVTAGFPEYQGTKLETNLLFFPSETGTIYVNGRTAYATDRFIRTAEIYGINSDWIADKTSNLQDKPYTFGEVTGVGINRSYVIYNGVVTALGTPNQTFVVSDPVPVIPGDKIFVNAKANFSNDLYAFYADNGTLVSHRQCESSTSTFDVFADVVTVPANAASIRVATATTTTTTPPDNPFVMKRIYTDINLDDLLNDVDELETDMDALKDSYPLKPVYEPIEFTQVVGYYINASGAVTSIAGETYLASDYIDISQYDDLYISGAGNWGNVLYAFYDDNKNVVAIGTAAASSSAYTTIVDEHVNVPSNAKYVYVCGRTGYSNPVIKAFSSYKAKKKWYGVKWACVGDSLTERNNKTTKNYTDYVAESTDIEPYNMGVSGSGYKRTEESSTAFYQRILNVPDDADVVTIFGSGNDLGISGTFSTVLGTPSDNTTDTICGCINQTIDNLYSILPTVQLGIITPCPWESYPPYSAGNNMELYAEAIVAICKRRGIPCLDLYHCSGLRPWDSTFRTLCYSKDGGNGVHPDEEGHKILAPHFADFLNELII